MQIPKATSDMDTKELANLIAILIKEITWLTNGHIADKNIQADSITARTIKAGSVTAEKMDVDELSAISADLGYITAGIMQAIQIFGSLIQGSQIQTNGPGVYPRVELSSTQNLLRAEASSTNKIQISAIDGSNSPVHYFLTESMIGLIQAIGNILFIASTKDIQINSSGNISISAFGHTSFENWNKIYSHNDNGGQTLKQALDSLSNRISALGG